MTDKDKNKNSSVSKGMTEEEYEEVVQKLGLDKGDEERYDHRHYVEKFETGEEIDIRIVDREDMLPLLIPEIQRFGRYDEYLEFVEKHKDDPDLSLLCLDKARQLTVGNI